MRFGQMTTITKEIVWRKYDPNCKMAKEYVVNGVITIC